MIITLATIAKVAGTVFCVAMAGIEYNREQREYLNSEEHIVKAWFNDYRNFCAVDIIEKEVKAIDTRKTAKCRNEHRDALNAYLAGRRNVPAEVIAYVNRRVGEKE